MIIFVEMSCRPEDCTLWPFEVVLFLALCSVSLSVFHWSLLILSVLWLQQLKHALGPDKPGLAGNGRVSWCRWAAGHALSDRGGDRCRSVNLQSIILAGHNVTVNIVWVKPICVETIAWKAHKIIVFLFHYVHVSCTRILWIHEVRMLGCAWFL